MTDPRPPEHRRTRGLAWAVRAAVLAVCLAVFALYLRPGFLLTLANQLWACF
ncbi:MAG TPA: hypothetical protein VFY35_04420 [Burkholderiaceae bacterium]|nr:hypothetical protein [Burkholderiaceae bacterium]